MPDTPQPESSQAKAEELTAAQVAKLVKRESPVFGDDGKPTGKTKTVSVDPGEVLSWAVRGKTVTVVTRDGQKLSGEL